MCVPDRTRRYRACCLVVSLTGVGSNGSSENCGKRSRDGADAPMPKVWDLHFGWVMYNEAVSQFRTSREHRAGMSLQPVDVYDHLRRVHSLPFSDASAALCFPSLSQPVQRSTATLTKATMTPRPAKPIPRYSAPLYPLKVSPLAT